MCEWEGGEQYQRAREQVAPVVINPPPTPGITLGPQGTTLYPPSQGWEEPMRSSGQNNRYMLAR